MLLTFLSFFPSFFIPSSVQLAPLFLVAQKLNSSSFNIYCTSNMDSTGSCTRIDTGEIIACEMIPGGVINCKQDGNPPIQCINFSGVIGTQAYFYCTRRTSPGVKENRINTQKFSVNDGSVLPNTNSDSLSPPLTPTEDNYLFPPSVFTDPVKDVFN